ncbi:MAG: response regulator transcription factor, partial [Rhodobacterales bacterium]|nr:response regulator transcription factor [Rhodobacterales bacterium]
MATGILIVDDDPQIRDVLRIALGQAGLAVAEAADGRTALAMVARAAPDLVVLDIGLPEMDGFEACRRLRRISQVPVLFLSAQDGEIDRVVGLELGADDYVTKPFSPRELVARIRAILKRAQPEAVAALRRGCLEVDPGQHLCRVTGVPVAVTAREMAVLARLMARPDQVLSRPQLVDAVYGVNTHVSDRTLDSHLRNLRAKLAAAGCADAIETVHGVGVRMGPCNEAP